MMVAGLYLPEADAERCFTSFVCRPETDAHSPKGKLPVTRIFRTQGVVSGQKL